jgi:hypothetical protein
MKFNNQNLHEVAEKYYFSEYLAILRNRKARKDSAYTSFMSGYTLPNKPLERNLRSTLENLKPNVHPSRKNEIESWLALGNYISDTDPNIDNYIAAIDRSRLFTFPDNDELSVRVQEENNFQTLVSNNPTETLSTPSMSDLREFVKLCIE